MSRIRFEAGLALLFVLIAPSLSLAQEGTIVWDEITSPALEGNLIGDPATRPFMVYLPPGYETSEKRYPVFYYLHGYTEGAGSGGMKLVLDRMIASGEMEEMIGVAVDGSNRFLGSQYQSSATIGDYETYIARDLVAYVDTHYRTMPDRVSRGITGYSMGGGGAIHLGLTFPDVFGVAVGQAGPYNRDIEAWRDRGVAAASISDWNGFESGGSGRNMLSVLAATVSNPDQPPFFLDRPYELVDGEIQFDPDVWQKFVEGDAMHDADRYIAQPVRLNGIKMVHGRADGGVTSIEQARAFDEKLTDLGIEHVYVEHEGGHEFEWGESLLFFLDRLRFLPLEIPAVVSATRTLDATAAGQPVLVEVNVGLDAPLETTGSAMHLDLSGLGVSSLLPLDHTGGGHYLASATVTPVRNGQHTLPIRLETESGERYYVGGVALDVYPEDLRMYEDGPGAGWSVNVSQAESDPASTAFVRSGNTSHAILLQPGIFPGSVEYVFDDPAGVNLFGYTHLEFYINGGASSGQDPSVGGKKLSERGVVVASDTWTLVAVPLSEFGPVNSYLGRVPIRSIRISGGVKETFYIDDLRLVAQAPPTSEPTAVGASEEDVVPSVYALSQNHPNPFNPETTLSYDLPEAGVVRLSLYNMSGQLVRTLEDGERSAGSCSVTWDGTDDTGRDVASGVYLSRMEVSGFSAVRKLVLVR